MKELQGKVALVTGAAGNLGRAVSERFRAAGAKVAGLDAQAAAAGIVKVDLCDAQATARAVDGVQKEHGPVDCLLNIAGGFRMAPAPDPAPWDELWRMNLLTALNTTRAVLPSMVQRGQGAIVNVGARVQPAGAQMAAYAASKSAVIRLTEALAAETRTSGVRVNCVMPSILDTPPNREAMPQSDPSEWVTPEALAEVMLFLCSDAARAIHGAAIPVYGRVA